MPSSSAAWVGHALILSGDDRGAKLKIGGTDNSKFIAKRASMVRDGLDCSLSLYSGDGLLQIVL